MNLKETRENLKNLADWSYDPNDFPGSKGWLECKARRDDLAKFDAEHPEIAAEAEAERVARVAAKMSAANKSAYNI